MEVTECVFAVWNHALIQSCAGCQFKYIYYIYIEYILFIEESSGLMMFQDELMFWFLVRLLSWTLS